MRALLLGVLLLGGCFKVQIEDGHLQCSFEGTCPTGYTCDKPSDLCFKNGETPNVDGGADQAELETDASTPGQLGHECSVDSDCTASGGNCVDGVCCNETKLQCGTCQACNIPGRLGFCSPVNSGVADPRGGCIADPLSCVAGGCNGSGKCLPASDTACDSTCTNGVDDHGQYDVAALATSKCDGSSATSAACKPAMSGMCASPGALCADAKTCLAKCTTDAQCAQGYSCQGPTAGKTCVARAVNGASCANVGGDGCLSRICHDNTCVECQDNLECPPLKPYCDPTSFTCVTGCTQNPFTWGGPCSSGGTYDSCGSGTGNSDCQMGSAPNCVPLEGVCECAADGTVCPTGQVCVNTACKVESTFPCVQNSDCASGTCTAGACGPMTTVGAPCQEWDGDDGQSVQDCGGGSVNCCVFNTCMQVTECD